MLGAKHLCCIVVVAAVLSGAAGEDESQSTQLQVEKGGRNALLNKMERVSDLDGMEKRLKAKRSKERTKKAQAAVTYMEKYKATKAADAREQARLRQRMSNDKMVLMKTTPGLKRAHELSKKHDHHVKRNMKRAINAMKKVDALADGKQDEDPTVKAAQKAVSKARGKEIYTVLGLDQKQLGKDYLLNMDAAVAAYDAKPSLQAHKKLERALSTAKERMVKDVKIERKKKSERRAKKERTAKNQKYYHQKWVEKTRELKRKKIRRDLFVVKLKKEQKHKAWVRRKNEDEIEKKANLIKAEKKTKLAKIARRQSLKNKANLAKFKIKNNYKAKLQTKMKKLNDILVAKKADARKKSIAVKRATELGTKAKQSMERKTKNAGVVNKMKKSAAKAYGLTKEKSSKKPSERNIKSAAKSLAYMRAKSAKARESVYKVKASKATMKERDRKKAVALIARKTAGSKRQAAAKKAASFKALMVLKLNKIKKGKRPKKRVRNPVARRRRNFRRGSRRRLS